MAVFLIRDETAALRERVRAGTGAIAALAFAYSLWAIGGAGAETVYWGFLLLLAGLPVYVACRQGRSSVTEHAIRGRALALRHRTRVAQGP